jgi:hypothetical protein
MTDEKKPIRRWGETPRASGTMRDLRSLRPADPAAKPAAEESTPQPPSPPITSSPIPAPKPTPAPEPPPQIKIVPPQPVEPLHFPDEPPLNSYAGAPITSFAEFKTRWKPFLRKGQLKICEALYAKTHAIGQTSCFTSFSELSALSGLKVRQCFNIIAQLEELKFVERTRIAKGSNKVNAGSTIFFYLSPKK